MEVGQVGVRTRARALAMASAKRRKIGGGELKFSSSLVQLRRRRRVEVTPENSISPETSGNSRQNDLCASPSSDHVPATCCSSNGSTEMAKERFNFLNLEDERFQIEASTYKFDSRERRETTPELRVVELGELESTARLSEANSGHRSTVGKMPSEAELDEFFSGGEKNLQKKFTEKYNYDIVKDVPLEGRYEWIQLKQ